MATYDQLPEFSAQLALMFREGLDERGWSLRVMPKKK